MAKLLDRILVVDVESTCWKDAPPPGEVTEIIQIGICPLDAATLLPIEKREIMVRPQKSRISPFCEELTGLTEEMVGRGMTFQEAARILKKEYGSQERLWASWGDYDRVQFERTCREYGVGYPFGRRHLNIKTLLSIALGESRELGLGEACEKFGLTFEGRQHRGDDDAWNIARLLSQHLLRARGGRSEKG